MKSRLRQRGRDKVPTFREKWVGDDLGKFRPILGLAVKDPSNQVLGVLRYRHTRGERVRVAFDALVGGLNVTRLEGWLANDHRVKDDAKAPNVDLERVPVALAAEDLGRDVIRGSANSLLPLFGMSQLRRQTEVADLPCHTKSWRAHTHTRTRVN